MLNQNKGFSQETYELINLFTEKKLARHKRWAKVIEPKMDKFERNLAGLLGVRGEVFGDEE